MPEEWRKLLVADAGQYAGRLTPSQAIPFGLPNISRWVLLVLAISAGLGFVPEYRSRTFRQRQAEKAILREAGQHLVELTRRNLSAAKPALAATRESLAAVDHLGEKMLDCCVKMIVLISQISEEKDNEKRIVYVSKISDNINTLLTYTRLANELNQLGKESVYFFLSEKILDISNQTENWKKFLQKK